MTKYATCECYHCHRILYKNEAYRFGRDTVESGRTGGHFGFGLFTTGRGLGKAMGYSMGHKIYRNVDVWLCKDCYEKERSRMPLWFFLACIFALLWLAATYIH